MEFNGWWSKFAYRFKSPRDIKNAAFGLWIDAQRNIPPQEKWISVEDRLPSREDQVQVSDGIGVCVACYEPDDENWYYGDAPELINAVTHWMPLSEPPKEGG